MIGTVLMERYRLEELIGEGGMASVYRALDQRTGHRVAVKFLRQEYHNDPEFLDRFRREATAASRMSHHNIVNLLDIGDDPKTPYLVFEFVDGKTLKEIITEQGRLPRPRQSRYRSAFSQPFATPMRRASSTGISSPRTFWWTGRATSKYRTSELPGWWEPTQCWTARENPA